MTNLNKAQQALFTVAQNRGWITPGGANEQRTAAALIRLGLLEVHPDYDGTVLRPVEKA